MNLQERLDAIHKKQGTGDYHNGSLNGNAVGIDLSKVKSKNGNTEKIKETQEISV